MANEVRVLARDRYAVDQDDGDTALVVHSKVLGQVVWKCLFCTRNQLTCEHVAAVRGFRRQAFLEDVE